MNGPQHYLKAEAIIEALGKLSKDGADVSPAIASALLAEAQVHATLAQAAVAALALTPEAPWREVGTWYRVLEVRED